MKAKDVYIEIAERYLKSAKQQLSAKIEIHEVTGFTGYHALESIACAVIVHFKSTIPLNHETKLKMFLMFCKRNLADTINVKSLAKLISRSINYSYREKFLYPDYRSDGNYIAPKDQLDLTQIRLLLRDVDRIISQILTLIK
ncbi:MAG: hypothetical protein AB4290_14835 [Spirulina sp.]